MRKVIAGLSAVLTVLVVSTPAQAAVQMAVPSWGLDRIDQANVQFDSSYTYPDSAGAGVRVYVLDTGVQGNLPGFEGRVVTGFDAIATFRSPSQSNRDCNGHGTHVAGIIASATYGVAKKATIVPVRVAGCDGGIFPASIVKGIDWVIKNHPRGTPGVVNLSIAVNKSAAVDTAIGKLRGAGLVAVAAAGNQNMDACKLSPAGSQHSLTVGSVNMNDYRTNTSNFGECVSIFAPGGLITSEGTKGAPVTRSGTSMAAAHVSGVAALHFSINNKAQPNEIVWEILRTSQPGIVVDAKSTKGNVLLNMSVLNK
jgi:serine protease